tara:strand:- start:300 stop:2630 length:2331 start_codon:yes stop_codon:yes gene_type:complete
MKASGSIGKSIKRSEDKRFLTGQGKYVDDINLQNQAYAAFLRSPYAHAIISRIDASEALGAPGVLLVVTGTDWLKENYGPLPCTSRVNTFVSGEKMKVPPRHCLAIDCVRFVGEIVAMVVAETKSSALHAVELIEVNYEELEVVTDPEEALKAGAPQLWDDIPNNLCLDFELGDRVKTAAAFESAHYVISRKIKNNRVAGVPIEPRGAIASYDLDTKRLTLFNSSQNIHENRDAYAINVLKFEKEKLHHVAPDIGGGFGVKNGTYPEPPLILHASKKLCRPVKWVADRSESFLSDTQGRGQVSTVSLALTKEGKFLGLRSETVGNLGAYCGTIGPFTPTAGTARTQGGPYSFNSIYFYAKAVFTNTVVMAPYRGAGRPEAAFQLERIIEEAARELDFDPTELRKKNLIQANTLPLRTAMGLDIDSGNFVEVFDQALSLTDRTGFPARASSANRRGKLYGFSIAPYLECTGGSSKEFAGITVRDDNKIELSVGSHSTGTGHETSFAQLLSGYLGIRVESIVFFQGDTDRTPLGGGHGGSRGMEVGGSAVYEAASAFIKKGCLLAAYILGEENAQLKFLNGVFFVPGTDKSITSENLIAQSTSSEIITGEFGYGYLNVSAIFEREIISIPNGCHACEVEVDPQTGQINIVNYWAVDDFGTIVNGMLTDGQVMGAVAQGIGQALMEESVYGDSGQLMTGSLIDYALPRAFDVPNIKIQYYEKAPTKKNPLGVKGAGEAGCVAAPHVVFNAIADALKNFNIENLDMPLTSEKIWRTIHRR